MVPVQLELMLVEAEPCKPAADGRRVFEGECVELEWASGYGSVQQIRAELSYWLTAHYQLSVHYGDTRPFLDLLRTPADRARVWQRRSEAGYCLTLATVVLVPNATGAAVNAVLEAYEIDAARLEAGPGVTRRPTRPLHPA